MCKAKVITLAAESEVYASEEGLSDWKGLLEKVNGRASGGADVEEKVQWTFGSVKCMNFVDIPAESCWPQKSWPLEGVINTENAPQRVESSLRTSDNTPSPGAALSFFDTTVLSNVAAWTQMRVDGTRRTVVASALVDRSAPAIAHFLPGAERTIVRLFPRRASSLIRIFIGQSQRGHGRRHGGGADSPMERPPQQLGTDTSILSCRNQFELEIEQPYICPCKLRTISGRTLEVELADSQRYSPRWSTH